MSETVEFWKGDFGNSYTQRNRVDVKSREFFWRDILGATFPRSVLEVGCNAGANLRAIRNIDPRIELCGVDVNQSALAEAADHGLTVFEAEASNLPKKGFDLVFTAGMLIHIPPEQISAVMDEIISASNGWVLAVEYADEQEVEVNYRGHARRLWRRPFGRLYQDKGLRIISSGGAPAEAFDNCTFWLMEKIGKYVLDCTPDSGLAGAHQALCPSPEIRPIPYGLVSLWEMINFNLEAFLKALQIIRMYQSLAAFRASGDSPTMPYDERAFFLKQFKSDVYPAIAQILEEHGRLDLISSDKLANKLLGLSYAAVSHELQALDSDIIHASEKQLFYHYPKEKGRMLERLDQEWSKTLATFPSAEEDVRAAVDCYALGHSNASVYHSMMVLELGLAALARRLRVSVKKERSSWGPVIDDIRDEIDKRRSTLGKTPKGSTPPTPRAAKTEKALLEPCQEAAQEFRYFTDVWRNHVAHGRARYDENDAKKVLDHVRTFMELIAIKLKLKEI